MRTQICGPAPTPPTDRKGRFAAALLVALLLHAPLAPNLVPSWFFALWHHPAALDDEDLRVVPIDLDLSDDVEPAADPAPAPAAPTRPAQVEASLPAEHDAPVKPAVARPRREKAAPAPSEGDAPHSAKNAPLADPADLAGQPAQAVHAEAANVTIYIATDVARRNALGAQFGQLLGQVPQWHELLGSTDLDPIHHFDHIWLEGPSMRSAGVVVAVVDYNVGLGRMQRAIEIAMRRSNPPGRWKPLTTGAAPLGTLDGGTELVSLRADKHLVVIAPANPRQEAALLRAKLSRFKRSGPTLIAMTVHAPARSVFARQRFPIPATIRLLRVTLTPHDDMFSLRIEADDADDMAAIADERDIASRIEDKLTCKLQCPELWAARAALRLEVGLPEPSFAVEGAKIRIAAELTRAQVSFVMKHLATQLSQR